MIMDNAQVSLSTSSVTLETAIKTPLPSNDDVPDSATPSEHGSLRELSSHSSASLSSEAQNAIWEEEDRVAEELLCQQINKLCEILWPQENTIKHRFSTSQLAARLRANVLLRHFVPTPQRPAIERLRGGDLNHITGITLPSSCAECEKDRNLILRVPRWNQKRADREVAVLEYVRAKTSIPVATVAYKDFGCQTPFETPYVIQHRIPGTDLDTVLEDLSHEQRCTIAGDLGRGTRTLLALESPFTGLIESVPTIVGSSDPFRIVPFELDLNVHVSEETKEAVFVDPNAPRAPETTPDLLKSQFGRWRTIALDWNCDGSDSNEVRLWDELLQVVREMDELNLFPTKANCLCHVDLHQGNIMVRLDGDSLEMTAILDWDEASVAPKFMNCRPPTWLWNDDFDDTLDDEEMDCWPYEFSGADVTPPTSERQEVKRIFEENAGPEWKRLAYDDSSRLSRPLFRVARERLHDMMFWNAAERVIKGWKTLRESLAGALNNSKGS